MKHVKEGMYDVHGHTMHVRCVEELSEEEHAEDALLQEMVRKKIARMQEAGIKIANYDLEARQVYFE